MDFHRTGDHMFEQIPKEEDSESNYSEEDDEDKISINP
jgi:hypothetical protein